MRTTAATNTAIPDGYMRDGEGTIIDCSAHNTMSRGIVRLKRLKEETAA